MKITDIVALVNAGWTKDEIMSIVNGEQKQSEEVEIPGEQEVEVQPVPEVKPEAAADEDRFKKLETKLDYVINRFNYMEVKNSRQPETDKTETIDDILSKIIK